MFSGISLATIIAAPLGSYLGGLIGWRNIFLLTGVLGVLALFWQFFTLPSMPPENKARSGGVLDLLRQSVMRWGMLAVIMMFTGHFAFFTYLRPFETSAQLNVNQLSLVLLRVRRGELLRHLAGRVAGDAQRVADVDRHGAGDERDGGAAGELWPRLGWWRAASRCGAGVWFNADWLVNTAVARGAGRRRIGWRTAGGHYSAGDHRRCGSRWLDVRSAGRGRRLPPAAC